MKLIVNADDFGLSHNRNVAVDYALRNGICTQGSIILNTPFSDEAVRMAKDGGYFHKIGLHLNLTVEKPLSTSIVHLDRYCNDGVFVGSNPRSKDKVFALKGIRELREELEAQIKLFFDLGFTFGHIDAHNDILFNMPVWMAFKPLIKKYKIKHIRGVEPYLFGYYRKSILSYLPLKYYFMYRFVTLKTIDQCTVLHGGRNVNQFKRDYDLLKTRQSTHRIIGNLRNDDICEVITHPDFDGEKYLDRTNFDKNRIIYSLEDTVSKIEGFDKITYNEI